MTPRHAASDTLPEEPEVTTAVVARSARHNAVAQVANQSVRLLTSVVLARLLDPKDFGVVALAMLMQTLLEEVKDVGMGATIVQRKRVDQVLLNSVFFANVVVGAVVSVLVYAAAAPVASGLGNADAAPAVRGFAAIMFVTSLGQIHLSLLRRNLQFRAIAKVISVTAVINAVVSIGCAFAGMTYWALVLGNGAATVTATAMYWAYDSWRPTAQASLAALRSVWRTSWHIFMVGFLAMVWVQGDKIIVSRFVGGAGLGTYTVGQRVVTTPTGAISAVLSDVAYAAFARRQDDNAALRRGFIRSSAVIALITFPMMFGVAAVAAPLVPVVFGDRWTGLVPVIWWLAPACAFSSITSATRSCAPSSAATGRGSGAWCTSWCSAASSCSWSAGGRRCRRRLRPRHAGADAVYHHAGVQADRGPADGVRQGAVPVPVDVDADGGCRAAGGEPARSGGRPRRRTGRRRHHRRCLRLRRAARQSPPARPARPSHRGPVEEAGMTRVSVGLPVYNGERYVRQALDSLMGQTHTDLEIIVSDNASTDATAEICRSYAARDPRIRYVRQEVNRGGAFNHNFVLAQATAPYFRMFACDDWMEPTCLEECAKVLDQQPDVVLAWTATRMVDEAGRPMDYRTDQPFDNRRPSTRLASLLIPVGAESLLQWSAPMYGLGRRDAFLERTGSRTAVPTTRPWSRWHCVAAWPGSTSRSSTGACTGNSTSGCNVAHPRHLDGPRGQAGTLLAERAAPARLPARRPADPDVAVRTVRAWPSCSASSPGPETCARSSGTPGSWPPSSSRTSWAGGGVRQPRGRLPDIG